MNDLPLSSNTVKLKLKNEETKKNSPKKVKFKSLK